QGPAVLQVGDHHHADDAKDQLAPAGRFRSMLACINRLSRRRHFLPPLILPMRSCTCEPQQPRAVMRHQVTTLFTVNHSNQKLIHSVQRVAAFSYDSDTMPHRECCNANCMRHDATWQIQKSTMPDGPYRLPAIGFG